MNKITRAKLINDIVNETGYSHRSINKFLYAFVKVVTENIAKGEVVTLTKFGSFRVKQHKKHPARNMKTGEMMILPARKKVTFRPTDYLKEYINSSNEKITGTKSTTAS